MPLLDVALTQADDVKVLAAYVAAEDAAKAEAAVEMPPAPEEQHALAIDEAAEAAGPQRPRIQRQTWVRRLREVDGIAGERMAPIHGRLIAHGLLQFQLEGQNAGVLYRVSTAGRQALDAMLASNSIEASSHSEFVSDSVGEAA